MKKSERSFSRIIAAFVFQIVRHDRTLEQIVFPIPEICELITVDTKIKVLNTTERDDQGSKVSDFFERTEDMFNEMKWQKKLRGNGRLAERIAINISDNARFSISIHRSIFRATDVVLDEQLHVAVEQYIIQLRRSDKSYRSVFLSVCGFCA